MGRTLLGGAAHEGNVNLLTPQQQSILGSLLASQGPAAEQAYSDFLQPYSPEQYQDFYQQSFITPAQQALQRQIIPQIQEHFQGLNESASGALNRALAQAASDVSTNLGQGILNQYNQTQQNRLGALGGLQGLLTQQQFEPIISNQQGILGSLLKAGSTLGGAYISRY